MAPGYLWGVLMYKCTRDWTEEKNTERESLHFEFCETHPELWTPCHNLSANGRR